MPMSLFSFATAGRGLILKDRYHKRLAIFGLDFNRAPLTRHRSST